jgi:hypothetical protein
MYNQCIAITQRGTRCRNTAQPPNQCCYLHRNVCPTGVTQTPAFTQVLLTPNNNFGTPVQPLTQRAPMVQPLVYEGMTNQLQGQTPSQLYGNRTLRYEPNRTANLPQVRQTTLTPVTTFRLPWMRQGETIPNVTVLTPPRTLGTPFQGQRPVPVGVVNGVTPIQGQRPIVVTPPRPVSPPRVVTPPMQMAEDCCICMDETLQPNEFLRCGHPVCINCLSGMRKNRCPMCAMPLEGPLVTDEILSSIVLREFHDEQALEDANRYIAQRMEEDPNLDPELLYREYMDQL